MKIKFTFLLMVLIVFACSKAQRIPNNELKKKSQLTEEEMKFASKKYKAYCAACHGIYGDLQINGAPNLGKLKTSLNEKIEVTKNGKGLMPPFKELLKLNEIELIAKYIFYLDELKQKNKR